MLREIVKNFIAIKKVFFLSLVFGVACFLRCAGDESSHESALTASRPNIVLIMADDMGFSDIGSYGGEIETPNLDLLATNGLRFKQFYNSARCCPTRASLLTGMYSHRVGMAKMVSKIGQPRPAGPNQGYIGHNGVTLAEALKPAGYSTYMSGKWHVGEEPENWPLRRGFEKYFGLISGASSYFEVIKNQPRVRQMVIDSTLWEPPAEGFYITDAITDYSVERIEQHAQSKTNPFFLYTAYTAPHWPLHALPEDIAKYENYYSVGWDSLRTLRYSKLLELGIFTENDKLSPRTSIIPEWENAANKKDWVRRMAVYAAMVDRMDQGVGRIVAALKAQGLDENTIIFFLSDNGACAEEITGRRLNNPNVEVGLRGSYVAYKEPWANASNTPFRYYKQWDHEGGISTPFIVHWPKHIGNVGGFSNEVGHVIDLMPTVLELAGAAYPKNYNGHQIEVMDGRSFLPALSGESLAERTLFWEHFGNRAVRDGKWKLVAAKNKAWELYDLENDRTELTDLSSEHADRTQELRDAYEQWAMKVGAQ